MEVSMSRRRMRRNTRWLIFAILAGLALGLLLASHAASQTLAEAPKPKPHVDKVWLALTTASGIGAGLDMHATLASCHAVQSQGYKVSACEADAFVRPLLHSTPLYITSGAISVSALAYLSLRMKHSHNRVLRRTWFIPQSTTLYWNINGYRTQRCSGWTP
jgi:hypothetical protein